MPRTPALHIQEKANKSVCAAKGGQRGQRAIPPDGFTAFSLGQRCRERQGINDIPLSYRTFPFSRITGRCGHRLLRCPSVSCAEHRKSCTENPVQLLVLQYMLKVMPAGSARSASGHKRQCSVPRSPGSGTASRSCWKADHGKP